MARILLGVTGSVAAYRAADLARDLMRAGNEVRVCLTRSAAEFVTPALFEALTGQPCLIDTFEEPTRGRMAHIDFARWADLILIAPATANSLNSLAAGIAEDMLTTLVLASHAPLVIAPAMNPSMYDNEATQASLRTLRSRAAMVVEPQSGDVACGENGQGKLASNAEILHAVLALTKIQQLWKDKKVVITSGPTEEPLDDVRMLTNRSSGKMGAALARAALLMGARVTVVAGPQRAALPMQADVRRVRTAQQMLEAALAAAHDADLIIGAAAVADYRPVQKQEGKIRSGAGLTLELVANPDVLHEVAKESSAIKCAFAAEPDGGLEAARQKILKKGVDAIAINNIADSSIGFDSDDNELTFMTSSGEMHHSGRMSKMECAVWILERLATLSRERGEA